MSKNNNRAFGQQIEEEVQRYLEAQGLKMVATNFSSKAGEIDLIMWERNTLVFVEVRFRKNKDYGTGEESVTWRKQQRIIKAAQFFLLKNARYARSPCRFDVVSVHPNNQYNTIHWIPNAFEAYS